MVKFPVKLILLLSLMSTMFSCTPHADSMQEFERWTSSDPLAIPHRVREQKYRAGNLVLNPSFEAGKIKHLDSLTSSTNIEGWSIIGDHVEWIGSDTDSLHADTLQVHTGIRSIRIHRDYADEIEDFGEGVFSDYVKVIPGNYQLSVWLNLKDIVNSKSRLGTRLYDAVNIRLISYDKNKIRISDEFKSPDSKSTIDNSFKALSLANFSETDSTGWIHVLGKSDLFPFPDGDLQDNTKFVRIFIGLKGTGTLWVDDVRLEYTRWNLTMLERLTPYFDTTLAKNKLIIPQPKQLKIRESLIYYRPFYKNRFPLILVPGDCDDLTMQAAERLESRMKLLLLRHTDLKKEEIPELIRTRINEEDLAGALIFSVGDNYLLRKHKEKLPLQVITDHRKGFFIHSFEELSNVVFLYGNNSQGNFYATQVALQLFDEKRLLFHNVNLIDYPSKDEYALMLLKDTGYAQEFLLKSDRIRFSELYIDGNSDFLENALTNKSLTDNYYFTLFYAPEGNNVSMQMEDILIRFQTLTQKISHINGLAIFYSYPGIPYGRHAYQPGLQEPSDGNLLQSEQQITAIKEYLGKEHMAFEILPEYGNNLGLISAINNPFDFYAKHSITGSYPVIWSGFDLFSWRIDEADLLFFRKYCGNPVHFLDLTMLPRSSGMDYFACDPQWPYKLQLACLFDPYSNEVLPEIYESVEKTVLGFQLNTVFDRIRLQTASDFFWNPTNYDPDLSLYRALVSEFGEQTTQDLVYFNDYYFKLKSELILAEESKNINKHQRRIITCLAGLKEYRDKIIMRKDDQDNSELASLVNELTEELDIQVTKIIGLPEPDKKY